MKDYSLAVIIPCWNSESYVGAMLDCLFSQSFSDWRAFLIDDGCTDKTPDIIKEYSLRDSRIVYALRNRGPKGAQTCRNIGFDMSEGAKYVVYFDSDDLISPNCFQQRVSYMEDHQECDFAVFPAMAFEEKVFDFHDLFFGKKFLDDSLQAMLNRNLPMVGWTNIYRRDSLVRYNLSWDERLLSMQDSDFNIQSLVSGMVFHFAEGEVDYFYRRTQTGISKKIPSPEHLDSHLCLLSKTLTSVSRSRTNYSFYLKNYVVLFFKFFQATPDKFAELINIPWIRKHVGFYLKLYLYYLSGFRGKKYLFRKQLKYSSELTSRWFSQMKKESEMYINSHLG